jgi:hypothetical protein
MRNKFHLAILSLLLTYYFAPSNLLAQQLIWEAFVDTHKIGELVAHREVNDENVKVRIEATFNTQVPTDLHIGRLIETTYVNQILVESSASSTDYLSGNESAVQVVKKDEYYLVNTLKESFKLKHNELLGTDLLYFEEPERIREILSLFSGKLLMISSIGNHAYVLDEDGEQTTYLYQKGELSEITIVTKACTIQLRLKP